MQIGGLSSLLLYHVVPCCAIVLDEEDATYSCNTQQLQFLVECQDSYTVVYKAFVLQYDMRMYMHLSNHRWWYNTWNSDLLILTDKNSNHDKLFFTVWDPKSTSN